MSFTVILIILVVEYIKIYLNIKNFRYDSQEECYNLEFIGDRPLELSNWVNFKELIKYGFEQLNPKWYE